LLQNQGVEVGVAADHTQFAAVEKPLKVRDAFRSEVRDVFSRRTAQRLQPEVSLDPSFH